MGTESTTSTRIQADEIARLIETARRDGREDIRAGARKSPRYRAPIRLDITTDPDEPACMFPATMHNIGDSGFSFWAKREVSNERQLWVREFSGDNSAPWVPARVVHCTRGLLGYLVGTSFEAAPTLTCAEPV